MRFSYLRAMFAGAVVWFLVISAFTILTMIPTLSSTAQSLIVVLLMTLFSLIGAIVYYRRATGDHGVLVGVCASATALLLDVFVTVPFFEIPNGGSYVQFFTSPILWTLVLINVLTFYLLGKRRARSQEPG